MKKLLTTISVCVLTTASLWAQGRINFNNSSATPLRINNPFGGAPVVLGTASTALYGVGPASARIQLLAGLTSDSLAPVLIGSAANQLYVTNTASTSATFQGTFAGGNPLPLPGALGAGGPIFLQFYVELINNGQYADYSPIIQVTPTLSPNAATVLFSATPSANQWSGFIFLVPEPSAMTLVGLSFSTMLLMRRRK